MGMKGRASQRISHVSQVQLAEILEVSPRQVRRWGRDGLPRDPDGRYPLAECIAWARERDREDAARQALVDLREAGAADYDAARARREEALADLAELQRDEKLGLTMTITDYEEELRGAMERLDAGLRALPHRLAGRVIGVETVGAALERIHSVIEDVRAELREGADIPEFSDEDE